MGKITISGDSLREIMETIGALTAELAGAGSDTPPVPTTASEAPKATRSRKRAEAPDPIQPPAAAPEGANPFTGEIIPPAPEPAARLTFAPAPEPAPLTFAPVQEATPVDRPAVARLKQQIDLLAQQHGYAQVMNWVMTTGFSQPAGTDPRDFLATTIHNFPDEALDKVYKSAGGK